MAIVVCSTRSMESTSSASCADRRRFSASVPGCRRGETELVTLWLRAEPIPVAHVRMCPCARMVDVHTRTLARQVTCACSLGGWATRFASFRIDLTTTISSWRSRASATQKSGESETRVGSLGALSCGLRFPRAGYFDWMLSGGRQELLEHCRPGGNCMQGSSPRALLEPSKGPGSLSVENGAGWRSRLAEQA